MITTLVALSTEEDLKSSIQLQEKPGSGSWITFFFLSRLQEAINVLLESPMTWSWHLRNSFFRNFHLLDSFLKFQDMQIVPRFCYESLSRLCSVFWIVQYKKYQHTGIEDLLITHLLWFSLCIPSYKTENFLPVYHTLLIISPASAKLFSPAVIADEGIIWSATSWRILSVPSLLKPKLAVFLSFPCLRPSFLSCIVPMMYVKGWWSDQVWVQSLVWVLTSHQREELSKPHVRLSLGSLFLPWIS